MLYFTRPRLRPAPDCVEGVNLMRFSSIFQLPSNQRAVEPAAQARVDDAGAVAVPAPPVRDLPEALDERVRLVGEWQLGDA